MPIFQRKTLRRTLGIELIRDTVVGTTSLQVAVLQQSLAVMDAQFADTSLSGQSLYVGAWLRVGSVPEYRDYRVASFNHASGAFLTSQRNLTGQAAPSASEFEIATLISPSHKNDALNRALRRVRYRREVTIPTVEGAYFYTIEGAASPNVITDPVRDILDVKYFADPTNSLSRDEQRLSHWEIVNTATAWELRIAPALAASQMLVLDSVVTPTLGSSDEATLNLPDVLDYVLAGAEVECWHYLVKHGPAQNREYFKDQRKEAAGRFSTVSARNRGVVTRKIELDDPY